MPIPFRKYLAALAAAIVLLAGSAVEAQPGDAIVAATGQIEKAAATVRDVDRSLDEQMDADRRSALRQRLDESRSAGMVATETLQAQLSMIDARILQLGPVSSIGTEAPDIAAQRKLLTQQHSTIDSSIKRGRLVDVEARQLENEIKASQTEQLTAQISARVTSPAMPAFWENLSRAAPRDFGRLARFAASGARGIDAGLRDGRPWIALAALLAAGLVAGPLQWFVRHAGMRWMLTDAPGHRVRRSGYALWRVVIGTVIPGIAAFILVQGLRWSGMVAEPWDPVLSAIARAAVISTLIAALGRTLLMPGQSSWRLLPIDDTTSAKLQPWIWLLAGLALLTPLADAFGTAVGASGPAELAIAILEALLHILLVSGVLVTLSRLRAADKEDEPAAAEEVTHTGMAFVALIVWIAVFVSIGGLILGYVEFSLFVSRMIAWGAIIAGALYLLLVATDDVATTVLSGSSRIGQAVHRGLGLRRAAIDQAGVLVSAAIRVLLVVTAVGLMLAPFGTGVESLFDRLGALAQGITVGGVTISPGAILRAILVLSIGMAIVRLFQRWLVARYLPTTDLDPSARNSVSLVTRYAGVLLVGLWGLASLGIGMERLALLLSALSVGIGFGLQAITQNFVSGLILLTERPVKIGDLVRIGNDEGDIKRISVRSTEIELADHSTLIVPNSELITKTVLNKTLANPLGRIQVQFSVPLGTDAIRVRTIVLDVFAEQQDILADPAPSAFVDGIDQGRILFNCFAHVGTQRASYPARSAVLFDLLDRLRREDIDIGTVPQRFELAAGATLPQPPSKSG